MSSHSFAVIVDEKFTVIKKGRKGSLTMAAAASFDFAM